jgi:hypothetical protein
VLAGAGIVAVVVVVEASDACASDVSVFCFSNAALKSAIAFRMPWGNGSDLDSAQYSCMRSNFASTFSTESQSSAGDVAVSVCTGVETGAAVEGEAEVVWFAVAVGSTIAFAVIGAVLNSFL